MRPRETVSDFRIDQDADSGPNAGLHVVRWKELKPPFSLTPTGSHSKAQGKRSAALGSGSLPDRP